MKPKLSFNAHTYPYCTSTSFFTIMLTSRAKRVVGFACHQSELHYVFVFSCPPQAAISPPVQHLTLHSIDDSQDATKLKVFVQLAWTLDCPGWCFPLYDSLHALLGDHFKTNSTLG